MFSGLIGKERKFRNLINGKWCDSKSGNFIEIKSPINGEIVGKVPAMTKEEVDEVITVAQEAKVTWREVPVYEKAKILYKSADILEERMEELCDILVREIAKDKKSAESEVSRTADYIRFTADTAKSMSGESILSDNFPGFEKNKI